jgi:hypothetical protein
MMKTSRKKRFRPPHPKDFIARREWEDRIGDLHSNRRAGSTIAARALKAEGNGGRK